MPVLIFRTPVLVMVRLMWMLPAFVGCDLPSSSVDGGAVKQDGGQVQEEVPRVDGGLPTDALPYEPCYEAERLGAQTVRTTEGVLRGQVADGVTAFLGIPYAEPPTGALRFKPTTPHACWEDERLATSYGERCAQVGIDGVNAGDEDCLTLNVWTPSSSSNDALRPVLFWIHGGANVIGSGYEPLPGTPNLYDGHRLAAEQDVVVVSINYRLGAFGFLVHESLREESAHSSAGNYAIFDMIEALQWTQRNIAALGGDPDRVMIFGESAGALNVCTLLTSRLTEGLFASALMQSGACEAPPFEERAVAGTTIVDRLGCADAQDIPACLRELSASAILTQTGGFPEILDGWDLPFGPTVDGYVLDDEPLRVLEEGGQQPVPLTVGSNAHESEFFLPYTIATCFDVTGWLVTLFGQSLASQIEEQYNCFSYPFARYALVDILTDASFTCPARRITRAAALHQPTRRYHYRYERADPQFTLLRAAHAAELAMVFGTYARAGYSPPPEEDTVSLHVMTAWAALSALDESLVVDGVTWPRTDETDPMMVFDRTVTVDTAYASTRCDFWDQISP